MLRLARTVLRHPLPRALSALAAQIVTTGFWALIDSQFVAHHAVWFILTGVALFIVAYFWQSITAYLKWSRGERRVHIASSFGILPASGDGSLHIMILAGKEYVGCAWRPFVGPQDFGIFPAPRCIVLELANHSDDTLINVKLRLRVEVSAGSSNDILARGAVVIPVGKLSASEDSSMRVYVTNESAFLIAMQLDGATGAPLGGDGVTLKVYEDHLAPEMILTADERHQR